MGHLWAKSTFFPGALTLNMSASSKRLCWTVDYLPQIDTFINIDEDFVFQSPSFSPGF
jgi:hypothetical protein